VVLFYRYGQVVVSRDSVENGENSGVGVKFQIFRSGKFSDTGNWSFYIDINVFFG
jgi:hypothetical protein